MMTTGGFADLLTALNSKIDHLERSRAPNRSKQELTEVFAIDLDKLWHNVTQIMENGNEIGTEFNLRSKGVADLL